MLTPTCRTPPAQAAAAALMPRQPMQEQTLAARQLLGTTAAQPVAPGSSQGSRSRGRQRPLTGCRRPSRLTGHSSGQGMSWMRSGSTSCTRGGAPCAWRNPWGSRCTTWGAPALSRAASQMGASTPCTGEGGGPHGVAEALPKLRLRHVAGPVAHGELRCRLQLHGPHQHIEASTMLQAALHWFSIAWATAAQCGRSSVGNVWAGAPDEAVKCSPCFSVLHKHKLEAGAPADTMTGRGLAQETTAWYDGSGALHQSADFSCALASISCAVVMLCRLHAARLKAVLLGWSTEAGSGPQARSAAADLGHIAVHCFTLEAHEQAQRLLRALSGAVDAPGRTHGIGAAVATAAEPHAAAGMQAGRGWPAAGADMAETEQAAAGMLAGSGAPAVGADLAVAEGAAAGVQAGSGAPAAGADPAVAVQAAGGMQAGSGAPAAGADLAVAERALRELLLKDCLDAMRWLAASRPTCHKVVYRWAMCRVPCRSWADRGSWHPALCVFSMSSADAAQHHSNSNLMCHSCKSIKDSWAAACMLPQESGCQWGGAIRPSSAGMQLEPLGELKRWSTEAVGVPAQAGRCLCKDWGCCGRTAPPPGALQQQAGLRAVLQASQQGCREGPVGEPPGRPGCCQPYAAQRTFACSTHAMVQTSTGADEWCHPCHIAGLTCNAPN